MVELSGSGGQGFTYNETQTADLIVGKGGKHFRFSVPFDVSACDSTPTAGGAATTGAVQFTATVTLDDR